MELARIKPDPGFEGGLSYQVSADLRRLPSLVLYESLIGFFYLPLLGAEPRFDPYSVHVITSPQWVGIARTVEAAGDRLRESGLNDSIYSDFDDGELLRFLEGGGEGALEEVIDALRLSARWLRQEAGCHPALTFYGV